MNDSRQCLLVITDSWKSPAGKLTIFERDTATSSWRKSGRALNVRVGRAGLAWGRGLTTTGNLSGPVKKEGDDKAPAGIFRLRTVFGRERDTKMPFIKINRNIVAVDDPGSRHYNQVLDESKVARRDWKHAEEMFRIAGYKRGVVVEHNVPAAAGAGSCIFLHIWEGPAISTSGCTALSEPDLAGIIRILDPSRVPVLVQLPKGEYESLRWKWNLP